MIVLYMLKYFLKRLVGIWLNWIFWNTYKRLKELLCFLYKIQIYFFLYWASINIFLDCWHHGKNIAFLLTDIIIEALFYLIKIIVLNILCNYFFPYSISKKFYQDGSRIEAAFRKYFYRADSSQEKDSYTVLVCHANVIRYFVCR